MTGRRIITGAVGLAAVGVISVALLRPDAALDAVATPSPLPAPECVQVVAHRGASADHPENTVRAFQAAVDQGADMVELDVHRTSDGRLVVIHDKSLDRTTNAEQVYPKRAPWYVRDFTLAEIQKLDAGQGQPVPTLDEVMVYLADTGTELMLEVKDPHLYPGLHRDIADAIMGHSVQTEVVSFNGKFLGRLHRYDASIPVGWIKPTPPADLTDLKWLDYINPDHRKTPDDWFARAHSAGLRSQPWTVNSAADMERMILAGADGITTDHPARLADVRACKK